MISHGYVLLPILGKRTKVFRKFKINKIHCNLPIGKESRGKNNQNTNLIISIAFICVFIVVWATVTRFIAFWAFRRRHFWWEFFGNFRDIGRFFRNFRQIQSLFGCFYSAVKDTSALVELVTCCEIQEKYKHVLTCIRNTADCLHHAMWVSMCEYTYSVCVYLRLEEKGRRGVRCVVFSGWCRKQWWKSPLYHRHCMKCALRSNNTRPDNRSFERYLFYYARALQLLGSYILHGF